MKTRLFTVALALASILTPQMFAKTSAKNTTKASAKKHKKKAPKHHM